MLCFLFLKAGCLLLILVLIFLNIGLRLLQKKICYQVDRNECQIKLNWNFMKKRIVSPFASCKQNITNISKDSITHNAFCQAKSYDQRCADHGLICGRTDWIRPQKLWIRHSDHQDNNFRSGCESKFYGSYSDLENP